MEDSIEDAIHYQQQCEKNQRDAFAKTLNLNDQNVRAAILDALNEQHITVVICTGCKLIKEKSDFYTEITSICIKCTKQRRIRYNKESYRRLAVKAEQILQEKKDLEESLAKAKKEIVKFKTIDTPFH